MVAHVCKHLAQAASCEENVYDLAIVNDWHLLLLLICLWGKQGTAAWDDGGMWQAVMILLNKHGRHLLLPRAHTYIGQFFYSPQQMFNTKTLHVCMYLHLKCKVRQIL
jgi:hypothetical protein